MTSDEITDGNDRLNASGGLHPFRIEPDSGDLSAPAAALTTANWVEPDFPFFSSVVDARRAGAAFPSDNLTPRALVLRVGSDVWAAFDVDLIRVAAIWRGTGVTPVALAPGSYHHPDKKTPGGQSPLPEPDGPVWLANGIYPGWQIGKTVSLADPREPAPSPEEVGRGPLSEELGRFKAIRQVAHGVVLEYTAGGANVQEQMSASALNSTWTFVRQFHVGSSTRDTWLVLGSGPNVAAKIVGNATSLSVERVPSSQSSSAAVWAVRVPAHAQPIDFAVACGTATESASVPTSVISTDAPPRRWAQEVTTTITRSPARDAYVVDDVGLPFENPWHRLRAAWRYPVSPGWHRRLSYA